MYNEGACLLRKKPEWAVFQNHVEFLFCPSEWSHSIPARFQTCEFLIYMDLRVTKPYVYVHSNIIETMPYINPGKFQHINNLPGIMSWTRILEVRIRWGRQTEAVQSENPRWTPAALSTSCASLNKLPDLAELNFLADEFKTVIEWCIEEQLQMYIQLAYLVTKFSIFTFYKWLPTFKKSPKISSLKLHVHVSFIISDIVTYVSFFLFLFRVITKLHVSFIRAVGDFFQGKF